MSLLVFRLGYMSHYDGAAEIRNGGDWIAENGTGGEMWNFRIEENKCYGYVMTNNFAGVNLTVANPNIGNIKVGDAAEGVDIVFIATKPNVGQVVIGWYKNATVYHKQYRKREVDGDEVDYLCEVDSKDAFLLSEEKRIFNVPSGRKGFAGTSNVWYPNLQHENREVSAFIKKLYKYIENSERNLGNFIQSEHQNFSINIPQNLSKDFENVNLEKIEKVVFVHQRNQDLVEKAKKLANGKCRLCERAAPFKSTNGEPYLEVHHVQWLSKNGADALNNVVALCPNCHRKMHSLNLKSDVEKLTEIAQSQK